MTFRAKLMSPTGRVLMALVVGLLIGIGVAIRHDPTLLSVAVALEPLGVLWVNAIRMTVIPLVVSLLITGVADRGPIAVGRLGARALLVFLGLLGLAALYALFAVRWSMHWLRLDPARRLRHCEPA